MFLQSRREVAWWTMVDNSWPSKLLGEGLVFEDIDDQSFWLSVGIIENRAALSIRLRKVVADTGDFLLPPDSDLPPQEAWRIRIIDEAGLGKLRSPNMQWVSLAIIACLADPPVGAAAVDGIQVGSPLSMCCRILKGFMTVPEAMARRGFLGISAPVLATLLANAGAPCADGASEFDIIMAGTMHFHPECSEDLLLSALAKRQHHLLSIVPTNFFDDPMVTSCFDEADVKEIAHTVSNIKAKDDYESALKLKATKYALTVKPRPKKVAKAKATAVARAMRDLLPTAFSREEAMKFMPKNTVYNISIFKDVKNARWQGHHSLMGSISRSWVCHGEEHAMKMVLAWAWYQAKELEGVEQPYAFLENIDWEKA